jgi:hypothetical protein
VVVETGSKAIGGAATRLKHWVATGGFWGGAWGLLAGPTLFYSATGTGVEADVRQALASLACGIAGAIVGAASACLLAMLTRHRVRDLGGRQVALAGMRVVEIDEARAYGLYDEHRSLLAMREEQKP